MNYITCFTGHRPEAFTWGADNDDSRCKILFNRLEDAIDDLIAKGCTHFIAGNALGIDTWTSEIVLEKKKTNLNLILEIAQPYEGHNARREEIKTILEKADIVHPVSTKERRNDAYLDRNKYMVDKSDFVVAIFDDSDPHSGGTWHTLDYAMQKGKIVIKIQWRDIR